MMGIRHTIYLVEKLIDMKIINIIVVLLFGITSQSIAQTDCKNNVSTNPNSPTNTNLPYLMNDSDELELTGDKYLNRFDWLNTGSIQNHYNSINMMFNSTPYEMNNITSYQSPEYEYISDEIAPLVINGWELLLVNLGYFPNSTDIIPLESADNSALPYIVLYNKYSGVIRVFTNFGEDSDAGEGGNAMEITLKFIETSLFPDVTGLVRLYEGYDRALDQETDVVKMTSIVVKPGQGSHWASTDFQVTYDPCTCFHISKLSLSVKSISVSDVVLNGLSISQTTDLVDANGNLSPNVNDFINGFEDGNSDNDKGGMLIYKNITLAIDEYVKEYENFETQLDIVTEHNEKVERNLLSLKTAKVIIAAWTGGVINSANAVVSNDENSLWTKVAALNKGYTMLQANGEKLFDTKKVMKNVKSILGETGETFIVNNLEVKNKPSKPSMPSVTLSEMKYTGKITTSTQAGGVAFYSPGVYGSSHVDSIYLENFYEYPVYNEVLGAFALLESPKIKLSHVVAEKINNYGYKKRVNPSTLNPEILTKRYQNWEHNYQIQLKEDLKFAFNDVLDIKSYEIKAAYNVYQSIDSLDKITIPNGLINARQGSENVNVESINSNITQLGYPIITDQQTYGYYNVTSTDTNWFSFDGNASDYTNNMDSSIKYTSPYVPIDAFKPYTVGVSLMNESVVFKTYYSENYDYLAHTNTPLPLNYGYESKLEIELKLMVDIEFNSINSDGVNNSTTLLLTYKVDPDDITDLNSSIVSNLPGSLSNMGQFPNYLEFNDTYFHGQDVQGCSRSLLSNGGSFYSCYANEYIRIDGDISVQSGSKVIMRAGVEINVINESDITPEVVLEIFPLLDYSQPMPKVDQSYITNFCDAQNVNGYQANRPSSRIMSIIEAEQKELQIEKERIGMSKIQFDLFPNPTTNSTTVVIKELRTDNVTIQLKDMMGKIIPGLVGTGKMIPGLVRAGKMIPGLV